MSVCRLSTSSLLQFLRIWLGDSNQLKFSKNIEKWPRYVKQNLSKWKQLHFGPNLKVFVAQFGHFSRFFKNFNGNEIRRKWGAMNYPKKPGFDLYESLHCAYITYRVKTWFFKNLSVYVFFLKIFFFGIR